MSAQPLSQASLQPVSTTGEQPPSQGYGSNILVDDELHRSDYLQVLYKRRWTALTAFLIVVLSVCLYTFTATPIYEARVQILIEKENTNVVSFKEVFEQNQTTDDYYPTQYKILQSRALARRTLDALKLWDHAQFNPGPDDSLTVGSVVAAPMALVSGLFKAAKPADRPPADETKTEATAIDRFLDAIGAHPNYALPFKLLGEAQEKKGLKREAIKSYIRYLDIYPHAEDKDKIIKRIEHLRETQDKKKGKSD